jgi:hypothetical protein
MKEIPSISQFGFSLIAKMKNNILLTILFFIVISMSAYIAYDKDLTKNIFSNFLDAFAGIVTLLVAIGLAMENYLKSWRESLPKTLTVHFTHQEKYYLSCYHADLTSEGDIRTWAQQLGQQMTNSALFDVNPFFDLEKPVVMRLDPNKVKVLHYEINIRLKSTKDVRSKIEIFKNKEGQEIYKRWFVIHNNTHENDMFIELKEIKPTSEPDKVDYKYAMDNQGVKTIEKSVPKPKRMSNEDLAEIFRKEFQKCIRP